MLFTTNKSWEIKPPMAEKFTNPGDRHYPMVELSWNFYLLHIDVNVEGEEGGVFTKRFLFGDIRDAMNALANKNIDPSHIKISIQSRRCDSADNEYEIGDVKEIIQAQDSSGQDSFIFVCRNEKRIICCDLSEEEDLLSNKHTIYLDNY